MSASEIIFHPFLSMAKWMDEKGPFKRKTQAEIMAEHMDLARHEAEQARRVIRDHMFTEHMARARIRALEDWNSRNEVEAISAFQKSLEKRVSTENREDRTQGS